MTVEAVSNLCGLLVILAFVFAAGYLRGRRGAKNEARRVARRYSLQKEWQQIEEGME